MSDVPFKGIKFGELTLTRQQLVDLSNEGRSHAQIGIWDDGTPAFVRITLAQELGEYSKAQPFEVPKAYRQIN